MADGQQPMIGRISGELVEVTDQTALIDVAGMGHEVDLSIPALAALPRPGGKATLYTHFIVRDDAQQLYGFSSRGERDLFRVLLRISGVGPRLALSVISSVDVGDLALAVAHNDSSQLVKVPGVGRKTAERIMVDLKDLLAELDVEATARPRAVPQAAAAEAERALVALGYKAGEAARAVDSVAGDDLSTEQIVRRALGYFAKPEPVS